MSFYGGKYWKWKILALDIAVCNLSKKFKIGFWSVIEIYNFFYHSALEEAMPDASVQLYTDACVILEEDGREQMAFDLYLAGAAVYIKLEK